MPLFKKKKKEEFTKTEPTPEMIKAEEINDEEVSEEENEEEVIEDTEEETDEEKELKKRIEEIENKIQEVKKSKKEKIEQEQPKILIKQRAVPVEFMFNDLSDRIEGIEIYLVQLNEFLKNKFK